MMEWLLVLACVVGVWTVLNIVGAERQRRVEAIQRRAQAASQIAEEQVTTVSEAVEVTPVK